ncbi:MAG: hypothetical protein ACOCXZ_01200 [Chloroflexota bacterium]
MASDTLQQAVEALQALVAVGQPVEEAALRSAAGAVVDAGRRADDEGRSAAVGALVDTVLAAPPLRAAYVALACGALVEQGAHPYLAVHAVITRLGEILGTAESFAKACMKTARDNDDVTDDPVGRYGAQVAAGMGAAASAYTAMEILCRPAIAMISRSERARRAANDEGRMVARVRRFPVQHTLLDWLGRLLDTLDAAEVVALIPGEGRGVRVQVAGLALNLQLNVLLEGALVTSPVDRPGAAVLQAAARYAAPDVPQHRFSYRLADPRYPTVALPHDGRPAALMQVEGARVAILIPAVEMDPVPVSAPFQGMIAELTVIERLTGDEVSAWLAQVTGR